MRNTIAILICMNITLSCVQEEHLKTVTFRVNMNAIEEIGIVGLKGSFTNPPWSENIEMIDADDDGIYEITISQEIAKSMTEFKFTHNEVYELQDKPNRALKMEYKPEEMLYTAVFNDPEGNQLKNNY